MARTKNSVDVEPIAKARLREKARIEEAKIRAKAFIAEQTADARASVLAAVRDAYLSGASKRSIASAYGTSDPHTINTLIQQSLADVSVSEDSTGGSSWKIAALEDGSYYLQVWNLGDDKRTGETTITLDEDGVNFTAIDGDLWVATLVYRLALVQEIMKEIRGRA